MEERAPIEMQWKSCPAKMYPKKAFLGWFIIALVGFFISTTSIVLGIGLTAILIATQATFLFTSSFAITCEGVVANYPIRKKQYAWEQVRRVKFFKDACLLFSRKKASKLDGWSGITLFYGENRDAVVSAIKSHLLEGTAT